MRRTKGFSAGFIFLCFLFIASVFIVATGGGGGGGGNSGVVGGGQADPPSGSQLTSISVTPANPSIPAGLTKQFAAAGTYSDGTTHDITTLATWSSSDTSAATVDVSGLATGIQAGTAAITAALGSISSGSATLTVTAATLTSISVTPASPSIPAGLTLQFAATGTYSDGTTHDITTLVTWSSSDTSAATVDVSGLATGIQGGAPTITATLGSVSSGSTILTVTAATLTSISVTPANPSIPAGLTKQFAAAGTYSDGTTYDITTLATWSSSDTSAATVDVSGLATGIQAGTAAITAALGSISSGSATLTVTAATLTSISVTPASPSIPAELTLQFAATGTYSDGTTHDITTLVTWSSSDTSAATVNVSGLATGIQGGAPTITATQGSISGNTILTVTVVTLTSISVTPANPSITAGLTLQFAATGTYSDGTTHDITTLVTWSSSDTSAATVNVSGLATGIQGGAPTITATQGSISGNTILTVTVVTLTSISVTPANPSITAGLTLQFAATGTYSDGTTHDITTLVTWSSSDTSAATVNVSGLATGIQGGAPTITATQGSISGNTILTVTVVTLTSISVTPANPSITAGLTLQFAATGTYSDGTTHDITTLATWSSSDTSAATVNVSGLATGIQGGAPTITATQGSISGCTTLTVTPGVWTWVSGGNTTNQDGVYGTLGVVASTNAPGSREAAATWTDSGGRFWLFGGYGYDSMGNSGDLNDLWKYDGTNWIWVSGSNTVNQAGVYGTKGVGASPNIPGARIAAVSWIDSTGALWLFGGLGYPSAGNSGYLNDLWKYDGTNWIWVSGSNTVNQAGVYGTKGVGASANIPGARTGAVSWIDSSNTLWLFGGYGYDSAGRAGYLNDLWKYDGTNWIWISGSNTVNQAGVYGTKGVGASANIPGARSWSTNVYGARSWSVAWTDSAGNLWLFGGNGYDSAGRAGYLNDLWKYDGTNWIWISGSNTVNQAGVYGTKGVGASANIPGARIAAVSWIDSSGAFWLFGGLGYPSAGNAGYLNDLWKYDGTNWIWISGSNTVNQAGVYGTKGVGASANIPGARIAAVSWIDSSGAFWLFGGLGYPSSAGNAGYLNDLWKYQ